MSAKLSERTKIEPLIIPQDIGTSDITSPTFIDMKGKRKVRAKLVSGLLAAAATVTLTLRQATDAAGSGAKNLGSAVVFTATANNTIGEIDIDVDNEQMDAAGGFTFLGAIAASSANGKLGAVVLEIEPDYLPAT